MEIGVTSGIEKQYKETKGKKQKSLRQSNNQTLNKMKPLIIFGNPTVHQVIIQTIMK